jgi:hypothetical protein
MVVDPQHTARYQPAGLYINRGAPKKERLVRETGKKNQKRGTAGKKKKGQNRGDEQGRHEKARRGD